MGAVSRGRSEGRVPLGLFPTTRSPLARFFEHLRKRCESPPAAKRCSSNTQFSPCDLPFPEAELVFDSVGFKTKSRFKTAQAARHVVNQFYAFYSWIELGGPDVGSAGGGSISFGFGLSAGGREGADRLLRVVLGCVRSGGARPLDGGRLRLAHEIRENVLQSYGNSKQAEDIAGAEFVNLDMVSLPAQAGVVLVSS